MELCTSFINYVTIIVMMFLCNHFTVYLKVSKALFSLYE